MKEIKEGDVLKMSVDQHDVFLKVGRHAFTIQTSTVSCMMSIIPSNFHHDSKVDIHFFPEYLSDQYKGQQKLLNPVTNEWELPAYAKEVKGEFKDERTEDT